MKLDVELEEEEKSFSVRFGEFLPARERAAFSGGRGAAGDIKEKRRMGMKLPNKIYDVMKWVVIIVLPAAATLYAALAAVWAWPRSQEIVTTITAVETFLGAVLCISSANYKSGSDGV